MRSASLLLVSALVTSLSSGPALAADAASASDRRSLAGHHFLVSHLVQDPFSVTSFGMNFAVGTGEALGPSLDFSGGTPTVVAESKWYSYVGLVQQFDLTVRIFEHLSLRAGLVAGLRQGAGDGSALVVGTSLRASGVGGVKGSIALTDAIRLSLSGDVGYGPHMNFLLLQGLREGVASGSLELKNAFESRNSVTSTITGAAAWGIFPWLALVANAQYLHAKNESVDASSQDGFGGAGSIEFDARPLIEWLPVGANLAYRQTGSSQSSGLATQEEYGGGVFYTGRPNLALGVEVDHLKGKLDTELKSKQTLAWVNFRYYW